MVIAIQVRGIGKTTQMLDGYTRTIPKAADEGLRKLAKKGVKNLRMSATQAGIRPWGQGKERSIFRGGIFARKGKGGYNIHITKHGIFMDRMRPHWVALKRGRDIRKWALEKGIATTAGAGARPRVLIYSFPTSSVYVRPHPYIQKGFLKTVSQTKRTVEKEINKAIRRKGK
ncbi:hypothetical protein LCGC14_1554150 [marine sediment metagenome]|uniref:Phage virion morphogenesis protein n=1 Tax=marine sediment metagenome TaxID=412755 RepID=A0A0F9IPG5_9ZZZZ